MLHHIFIASKKNLQCSICVGACPHIFGECLQHVVRVVPALPTSPAWLGEGLCQGVIASVPSVSCRPVIWAFSEALPSSELLLTPLMVFGIRNKSLWFHICRLQMLHELLSQRSEPWVCVPWPQHTMCTDMPLPFWPSEKTALHAHQTDKNVNTKNNDVRLWTNWFTYTLLVTVVTFSKLCLSVVIMFISTLC